MLPIVGVRWIAPRVPLATVLPHALSGPLVLRTEVLDAVGVPYGYALEVQDGAYLLLFLALAWRAYRARTT